MAESKKNIYGDEDLLKQDKEFVLKKLDLTDEEFNAIMKVPIKRHTEFKSYINIYKKIFKIKRFLKRKFQNKLNSFDNNI